MEAIYDYIADELLNPDAAMGQYNRIADAIASTLQRIGYQCQTARRPLIRGNDMTTKNKTSQWKPYASFGSFFCGISCRAASFSLAFN